MRRFKSTPRKKLIGMVILFVFIPLFLLWYAVFFLDNRPDETTLAIIVCVALLAAYLYWRYRKAWAGTVPGEEKSLEAESGEGVEGDEGLEEDFEGEPEQPEETPESKPGKSPKS